MKTKKFKKVQGPFGVDEKATHEAFENFVGGPNRAFQLNRIWNDSHATKNMGIISAGTVKDKSRSEVFSLKAAREGFSKEEIEAFFSL